jgi:hypothetical protein
MLVFSWRISGNATKYAGILSFRIQFLCLEYDNRISYAWHTDIFKDIIISDGFDNAEAVVEQYSDVLEAWKQELEALQSTEAIRAAVNEYMEQNPYTETDPTVPAWAKQPEKPAYTAEEVGAIPNPAAAEVGQTIQVSVVDENGKPAAWEAVDFPKGGGKWKKIVDFAIEEEVAEFYATKDLDGNQLDIFDKECFLIYIANPPSVDPGAKKSSMWKINGVDVSNMQNAIYGSTYSTRRTIHIGHVGLWGVGEHGQLNYCWSGISTGDFSDWNSTGNYSQCYGAIVDQTTHITSVGCRTMDGIFGVGSKIAVYVKE